MSRRSTKQVVRGIAEARRTSVLAEARAAGLIGAIKDRRISGRVSARLLEAAKTQSGVTSDSELIELALSQLALEDDFGAKLIARSGTVPADIDLDF